MEVTCHRGHLLCRLQPAYRHCSACKRLWVRGMCFITQFMSTHACTHHRYDHLIFEHGAAAEQACRRPRLWVVIAHGDSLAQLTYVHQQRLLDTQTLNQPLKLWGGFTPMVCIRFLLGDLPALQRLLGIHSAGSAQYRCPWCEACGEEFGNLCACVAALPRTLEGVAERAQKLAHLPSFRVEITPKDGAPAEVARAVTALGGIPTDFKKDNMPQLKQLLKGVRALPALFGKNPNALTQVKALKEAELIGDAGLHDLKGEAAWFLDTAICGAISVQAREDLAERRKRLLGGVEVKSGAHRRLELANLPALLNGLGVPDELYEAGENLVRAAKCLMRERYCKWQVRRHHVILRACTCWFKYVVLLNRVLPVIKKTAQGTEIRLRSLFHHSLWHSMNWIMVAPPDETMLEAQEALWKWIRDLTVNTSNHRPGQACVNVMLRGQMRVRTREESSERQPAYAFVETTKVSQAYKNNGFDALDAQRDVLDKRFLQSAEFSAYRHVLAAYFDAGVWHTYDAVAGTLELHDADADPEYLEPTRHGMNTQQCEIR